jgi:MFS family permease
VLPDPDERGKRSARRSGSHYGATCASSPPVRVDPAGGTVSTTGAGSTGGAGSTRAIAVYQLLVGVTSGLYTLIFTLNLLYQVKVVGLSPLQLVLVGTVLEAVVFVAEVPTGIVADLYSRKLSIIIGLVLVGCGFVLEGSVPHFGAVVVGQVLWGVGFTFTSGAIEAWITDEVGSEQVAPVFIRGAQIEQIASFVAIAAAGLLGLIWLRLPIIVGGAGFVVFGLLLIRLMPESGFRPHTTDRTTLAQMREQFSTGLALARRRPVVRRLILVSLVVGLSSEAFDRLWTAHLLRGFAFPSLFGHDSDVLWFSIIAMIGALLAFGFTTAFARISPTTLTAHHPAKLLAGLAALQVVATATFAVAGVFGLALAALWVRSIAGVIAQPVSAAWMNRQLEPGVRATVLSMESQVNAIGQVVGGPALGWVGSAYSIRAALIASAGVLTPVVALYARIRDDRAALSPVAPTDD